MMSKGLFFDLDGTLVDTLRSNVKAYHHAIQCVLGEHIDVRQGLFEEIKLGKSSEVFLRELVSGISDDEIRKIAVEKSRIYPECLDQSFLNESLIRFIEGQSKGTTIVLVTTAKERNAMNVLRYHRIQDIFDFKVFGDHIQKLKPDPEIYLTALALTGLCCEDSEAYEDSEAGIRAAKNAGMIAHRVIWNSNSEL